MKSGPTPAFVLARVCAPAWQAWLPVSDTGCGASSLASWPLRIAGGKAVNARLGRLQLPSAS
jgi:hypothetical protein